MFWNLLTGGPRTPFHSTSFSASVSDGVCRWAELQDYTNQGGLWPKSEDIGS